MSSRVRAVAVELTEDERRAAIGVLDSGHLVQGAQVAAFEEEFGELVDGRHCVAVNAGTSALHLGLLALGIGPGDEVVVPSFTFAASANAVAMCGATPVFADIDPGTFCLAPDSVAAALTDRTRAIMSVHLFGQPAPMDALRDLATRHGLAIVEDACQAHAARYRGEPVGALGDVAAFSFYATKNLSTGEGGMVVTADPGIARRVRLLRNQGMEQRYRNEIPGLNNRMTEVAAAIGRVQLTTLSERNERRRAIAARYDAGLGDVPGLTTPSVAADVEHVFHQYTVRHPDRDALASALDADGIDAAVYYPVPTHRLPAYASTKELPATDEAAASCLSLPIRPGLTDAEVDRVVAAVRRSIGGRDG